MEKVQLVHLWPLLLTQNLHKSFKLWSYPFDPRNSFQVLSLHFGLMTETQANSWPRIGQTPSRRMLEARGGQWSKANPKTSLETSSNKKRPKMLLDKSSTNRAADSISKGGWPRSNFWLFKASQATFSLVSIKKFEEATQKTSISSQTPVLFTLGVHGLRGEDCQQIKLVRPKKIGKKNWNGVELRKFSSPCPTKPAWRRWSSRQAGCPSPWEIEECPGVVLGVTHPSFGPTRKVLDFILGFFWCQPMPTPHLKTTSPSENGTRRRRQNLVLTSAMVSPARLSKNYIISHNMD